MSFIKPLFALVLAAFVGTTVVACASTDTDSAAAAAE